MIDEVPTVHTYEDPDWDGVWAACPHCEHENGVTWKGKKTCNQCDGEFIVAAGPLVLDPTQPGMPVLQESGDLSS